MWHFRCIFDAGLYIIITCEVDIVVGCVLAHIYKDVGLGTFSLVAVWVIFAMWQSYLFSYIRVDLSHMYTYMHACLHS